MHFRNIILKTGARLQFHIRCVSLSKFRVEKRLIKFFIAKRIIYESLEQ